ncbi:MAG: hypothetical protein WCW52_02955 [Elusimicrobiales bacterium]|jgi:hypothetical protein
MQGIRPNKTILRLKKKLKAERCFYPFIEPLPVFTEVSPAFGILETKMSPSKIYQALR